MCAIRMAPRRTASIKGRLLIRARAVEHGKGFASYIAVRIYETQKPIAFGVSDLTEQACCTQAPYAARLTLTALALRPFPSA